ncbi:MAG: hypothetical protein K2M16_07290, partial [Muribaculaceae bacterium]|nr:hypothetical protein [Muribaculaceae bacterium]
LYIIHDSSKWNEGLTRKACKGDETPKQAFLSIPPSRAGEYKATDAVRAVGPKVDTLSLMFND